MASGTFEKTNFDWQTQQVFQRVSEWLERLLTPVQQQVDSVVLDDWGIPSWLLQGLVWLITIGVAIGLGWQLYELLKPYFQDYWRSLRGNKIKRIQPPRREETSANWLQKSQAAQQQGNYREACRALYMAMLHQLNERNLIRQESSRTDGEYLSLIQTLNAPQPYEVLIRTHERLCFSGTSISSEAFDRCWQAYQEIEQQ